MSQQNQRLQKQSIQIIDKSQFQTSFIPQSPQGYFVKKPIEIIQPTKYYTPVVEKEKDTQQEQRITQLILENERIQYTLTQKCEESESWKAKVEHLEQHLYQLQQTENKYVEMEKKVDYLILENKKLNKLINDLEAQLEIKIQNIDQLNIQINQQNNTQQKFVTENKQIIFEIDRLNIIINTQKQDINDLRQYKINYQQLTSDNDHQKFLNKEKNEEIENLKSLLQRNDILIQELRQKEIRLMEIDQKYIFLQADNERLSSGLKQRIEENENQKLNNQKLQFTISDQEKYKHEIQSLTQLIQFKEKEITEWRNRNQRLEDQIQTSKQIENLYYQLKNDYSNITEDFERQNYTIKCKQEEIENVKIQNTKLNIQIKETQQVNYDLENKATLLSGEIERLNSTLRQKAIEIDDLRQRYTKLDIYCNEISVYQNDCSKYKDQIKYMERDIEDSRNRNSLNQEEILKLNQQLTIYFNEIEEYKKKIKNHMTDSQFKQSKLQDNENNIQYLNTQIEQQKQDYHKLQQKCNQYENQIQNLNININDQNRKIQFEQQDNKNKLAKIEELENHMTMIVSELERQKQEINQNASKIYMLENEIRKKQELIEDLKNQHHYELSQKSRQNQEHENNINVVVEELEKLQGSYNEQKTQIDIYILDIEEMSNQINVLQSEITRLEQERNYQQEEMAILKSKYVDYNALYNKYLDNQGKIVIMAVEVENLRQHASQKDKEIEDIRQKNLSGFRQSISGTTRQSIMTSQLTQIQSLPGYQMNRDS